MYWCFSVSTKAESGRVPKAVFGMVASHSLEMFAVSAAQARYAETHRHMHTLSRGQFVSSFLRSFTPFGSQLKVLPLTDRLCLPNLKWPAILILCKVLVPPDSFLPCVFIYQTDVQPDCPWSRSSIRLEHLSVCPHVSLQPRTVFGAQWVFLDRIYNEFSSEVQLTA